MSKFIAVKIRESSLANVSESLFADKIDLVVFVESKQTFQFSRKKDGENRQFYKVDVKQVEIFCLPAIHSPLMYL